MGDIKIGDLVVKVVGGVFGCEVLGTADSILVRSGDGLGVIRQIVQWVRR